MSSVDRCQPIQNERSLNFYYMVTHKTNIRIKQSRVEGTSVVNQLNPTKNQGGFAMPGYINVRLKSTTLNSPAFKTEFRLIVPCTFIEQQSSN